MPLRSGMIETSALATFAIAPARGRLPTRWRLRMPSLRTVADDFNADAVTCDELGCIGQDVDVGREAKISGINGGKPVSARGNRLHVGEPFGCIARENEPGRLDAAPCDLRYCRRRHRRHEIG